MLSMFCFASVYKHVRGSRGGVQTSFGKSNFLNLHDKITENMPRTPPYPTNSDIPQTPTSLEKKILDPHMNSLNTCRIDYDY